MIGRRTNGKYVIKYLD